jgi:hypothetical protein
MSEPGEHTEHENHGWDIYIPDHPPRSDSPEYVKSRAKMHELANGSTFFGKEPCQDHHGGGLWLKDGDGWFLVKNLAGIEWSAQFCADPAKVDALRINAKRIYAGFPDAVTELGIEELLNTPITDAAGVAAWVDSICNASVPLPGPSHTGVLPAAGGVHHYPTPITDIETIKHDDFNLWVQGEDGTPVAVVPVAPRGSGDARVAVVWAPAGFGHRTPRSGAERAMGGRLNAGHYLARQAYAEQET